MASIKINNLQPTGLSLFSDSETFLDELKGNNLNAVNGGTSTPAAAAFTAKASINFIVC
ncbi:MAG TPA: hypothetical protein VK203_00125 [Nostocaceae cyanobacterium]|nr:hypothetical protein [Nostocaceae cyanobacterium]